MAVIDRPAEAAVAEAEARAAEATAAAAETPEATEASASGGERTGGTPAASGALDIAGAGDPSGPVRGVGVCEKLESALLANAYDFDLYAAAAVVDELRSNTAFRNPETGESSAEDVASWAEASHPGTCSLSAGGDAWYRLTLRPLTGDRGDYATDIATTTSYAEGGP